MPKYKVKDEELHQLIADYLAKEENVKDVEFAIQTPGTKKEPRKCASGSGVMTSGGQFAPGMDAKLKSALYHIVRGNPDKIPEELKEHGPEYRPVDEWTPELAKERLAHHGWPMPVPPKPKAEKPEKKVAEGDDGSTNSDGETKTDVQSKAARRRAVQAASKAAKEEAEGDVEEDETEDAEIETEEETV